MAGNQGTYNHFADLQALEAERDKVLEIYESIKNGILDLNKVGFKIDSAKGLKEIADAEKTLQKIQEQLAKTNKELADSEKRLALAREAVANAAKQSSDSAKQQTTVNKTLASSIDDNIKKQADLKRQLDDVNESLKKLKAFEDVAHGQEEFTNKVVELTKKQAQLKIELQSTTKFINNQTKEFLAQEGSLDELRAKLNQMIQVYDALGDETKNSSAGQAQKKAIVELTEEIKKQEFETLRFQRNVGNYKGSAKIIVDALGSVEKKLEELKTKQQGLQNLSQSNPIGFKLQGGSSELNAVTNELKGLTHQYEVLNEVVSQPTFLKAAESVGNARREVRGFKDTLTQLNEEGLGETDFAKELESRLGKLKDASEDTADQIKAMASDTYVFDRFAEGIGTIASAWQVAAAGAELFGADSDKVQQSMQRLMAIQNLANGVRAISVDITTKGTTANKIAVAIQGLFTTATNASTAATIRLNAALKLSAIGLAIGLLGFAASKMGLFGGETEESTRQLEAFDVALENSNIQLERQIKNIQLNADLRVSAAKKAGASDKELNDIALLGIEEQKKAYDDLAAKRNEGLKTTLDEISHIGDADFSLYTAMDLGITSEELQKLRTNGVSSLEELDAMLIKIKSHTVSDDFKDRAESIQKETELVIKNLTGLRDVLLKSEDETNAAKRKSADFDANQAEKARQKAEKAAADQKKRDEEERKNAVELSKFRLELLANEQAVYKNTEAPDVASQNTRIKAAQKEFEFRKQIVDIQAKYELSQEEVTSSQRILIKEKAAEDIRNLELKLATDIAEIHTKSNQQILDEANQFVSDYEELQSKALQDRQDTNKKFFDQFSAEDSKRAAEEKAIVIQNLKDKKITQEEYAEQISAIDTKYNKKQLKNLIDFLQTQINILKEAGISTIELEAQIADVRNKLNEEGLDKFLDIEKEKKQRINDLKDAYFDLGQSVVSTFNDVLQGAADTRKNQIQEEIDKVEELKNANIKRVSEEVGSEEEKAARIKIIEAKAQQDKEALQRRQRAIDRQKALFERTFKAFQITTDGIQAVNKLKLEAAVAPTPLKPFILAQIPYVIASTALSLVSLLSTPIPKFGRGTKSSPEGLAEVGEAGPELGISPEGKLHYWDRPTITHLKKGTQIFNSRVTKDILSAAESDKALFINGILQVGNKDRTDEILRELREIKNKKQAIAIHNEHGIESSAYYQQQMKY